MNNNLIETLESPIPSFLNSGSEDFEKEKVESYGFMYLYNKSEIYSKASLTIYEKEDNEKVVWLLWVRFELDFFLKLADNLSYDLNNLKAKIHSPILFYEDNSELEVEIYFELGNEIKFPRIKIIEEQSELSNDYHNGISKEKYIRWQEILGR